jgi:hypothetical protein
MSALGVIAIVSKANKLPHGKILIREKTLNVEKDIIHICVNRSFGLFAETFEFDGCPEIAERASNIDAVPLKRRLKLNGKCLAGISAE